MERRNSPEILIPKVTNISLIAIFNVSLFSTKKKSMIKLKMTNF